MKNEILSNIMIARLINMAHGGTVIGAWDVGKLTDDYIDACRALVMELPSIQEGISKVERIMQEHRDKHPQYRKYKH